MVYSLFKDTEDRYLKWMNYYSLFNGALLVAYYSIFQLLSNETQEFANNCAEISNSNHWNILALIAILGCVASYCWYLSTIYIHMSVKDISQSEEKSEIVFKIEVLNSDSLILNESVKTTIKH